MNFLIRHARCYSTQIPTHYKIGIIGLGNVGDAVIKNFLRNKVPIHYVFDKDKTKGSYLSNEVIRAENCKHVTENCDVIFTALPNPASLKEAAETDSGIVAGIKEGKTWIDHSSTDYEQTLKFAADVEGRGGAMLEAPITGGLEALKKGQMTVYLGGDKDLADKFTPLLKPSFQTIMYMGKMGNAQLTKIATNMLCASNAIAMGEMLMLAKKYNMDLTSFWHAGRVSAGNSFVWETAGPTVLNGTYDKTFTMELFCKDMHLGYELCKKAEVPIPFHNLTQALSNAAMHQFGKEGGCYSTPRLTEVACHETLQTPGFEEWTYDIENVDGSSVVKHRFKS